MQGFAWITLVREKEKPAALPSKYNRHQYPRVTKHSLDYAIKTATP
jgi:hypothetical protein